MKKITIIIFFTIIILILGFTGYLIYKNKLNFNPIIKDQNVSQNNPNLLNNEISKKIEETKDISSPGKIFGPIEATHAQILDNQKIIELTNSYRADNDLPPLKLNDKLENASKTKVQDMFNNQYFEHNSPAGITPSQLVLNADYDYRFAGENLALGDFKDEKDLVDAWMVSPGHRANLLNPNFLEIGVTSGLNKFKDRTTWISVQEFGKQMPGCADPDKTLLADLITKKDNLIDLTAQSSKLSSEYKDLISESNNQIAKGNQVASETQSNTEAQPYWDRGSLLNTEAKAKYDEAKQLESNIKVLQTAVNSLSEKYNSEVSSFNICIKQ